MSNHIYYEDFIVDESWHSVGEFSSSKDHLISFAKLYDPQPMHLDEEAGKASMLGGLASSGWQTGALLIKQMVERLYKNTKNYGSPGVKEAHWLQPVFPNDVLSVRYQVHSKRVSNSKSHMGIIDFFIEAKNQTGEPVMTMVSTQFIGLRGDTP